LIVSAVAVLLAIVVGARTAEMLRQLHAAPASHLLRSGSGATGPPRADAIGRTSRRHGRARHGRSAPTRAALARRLNTRIGKPRSVSVAAVDLVNGRRFSYGARHGMIDASVSKLDVLEALLLHNQVTHTSLTAAENELATAMIEHSDNEAGQTLWDQLGYAPAIAAANKRLGLRRTVPDPIGYYGLTTSSARDQLALLENLVSRHGPLTAGSRAYAKSLLGKVEADQRWGVPAAADPRTSFEVKNGWLPVGDAGGWVVNSDGIITADGHTMLITVMTRHDRDEQDGIKLVEAISRAVAAADA
jgi:hypothetical protein